MEKQQGIGFFEKYLTLWVALCIVVGIAWSYLTKGDAAYTLVQVAVNDLIILVAFASIVAFLLGVGGVGGLLLTLVILFSFHGETILNNPPYAIPIGIALMGKGMSIGAVIALIIGGAGMAISEMSMFASIFKKKKTRIKTLQLMIVEIIVNE